MLSNEVVENPHQTKPWGMGRSNGATVKFLKRLKTDEPVCRINSVDPAI